MSEVKHTPGPWEVECVMCDEVNGEAYEVHADGGAISIAAPPSEADAYLIAAAPDLLAAAVSTLARIDQLQAQLGKEGFTDAMADTLRSAVAKATGTA